MLTSQTLFTPVSKAKYLATIDKCLKAHNDGKLYGVVYHIFGKYPEATRLKLMIALNSRILETMETKRGIIEEMNKLLIGKDQNHRHENDDATVDKFIQFMGETTVDEILDWNKLFMQYIDTTGQLSDYTLMKDQYNHDMNEIEQEANKENSPPPFPTVNI